MAKREHNNKNRLAGGVTAAPGSDSESDSLPLDPGRRRLLKNAGFVGAAAVGSASTGGVLAQEDRSQTIARDTPVPAKPGPLALEALEVLTAAEAETLEVICDCLIPADENGPGAREARAVHYIDRSLASHNREDRHDYMVSLTAIDDYARSRRGRPFHRLIRDQQESIILALQNNKVPGCSPSASGFFNMMRSHIIDGTFCDPYYGGNQNFVGWDMIRYPGVRLSTSEADVAKGGDLAPNHQSAYDHQTYTKMAANMQLGDEGGSKNA